MRSVALGIFVLDGLKTGRSYLVEGDDGIALVDASSNGASSRILASIESAGHRPDELRMIVATHYHHDHTGNVAALIERTGAQLAVYDDEAPCVDGRIPWLPLRPPLQFVERFAQKPYLLKIDRLLRDGDIVPFAGGLQVVHTPGHTPGHIALYSKDRSVLFAGDALMNIGGLRLPMAVASHDMDQARESARRLAELDFDVALPGHGAPIIGRASEKIAHWARTWL